ncbi:MAG TPA: hypothetical protein VHE14_02510 [Solirubrobacteraceae bacterium]|nr:hypothetical protein [Solirubrobacteraceae bacterium]
MARVLIIGCGCRGRALAGALRADGHAVRGTTRARAGAQSLSSDGIEAWVGDPDRVGSLVNALDGVTVLCWLLGSAAGSAEALAALHGPRLQAMLSKTVDTTVRGVVYEATGSVDRGTLAGGVAIAQDARERWEIPVAVLAADPARHHEWLVAARTAVNGLLLPEAETALR